MTNPNPLFVPPQPAAVRRSHRRWPDGSPTAQRLRWRFRLRRWRFRLRRLLPHRRGQFGPVTLDFWTHDPGYVKTYTAMAKTMTDPFQITLKVTNLSSEAVVTKMLAQAQAKTGTPDVIGVEVSQFPRTMKNNIAKSIFVNWTEILTDEQKADLRRCRITR